MCDCINSQIPEALWQNGRDEDQVFDPIELIFRRTSPLIPLYDNDGKINSEAIGSVKNISVVRGKYISSPKDALFDGQKFEHKLDWHVISIKIENILKFMESLNDGKRTNDYSLSLKHEPYKCLFAHTEINTLRNNQQIQEIASSKKSELRAHLALYANVEIENNPTA